MKADLLAPGTAPLSLDQPGCAYLVVEGSVDVFAVPLEGEGQGPRRHLWSAGTGDILPAAPHPASARHGLIVVGLESTRLRAVPMESLGEASMASALDRLVAALAPRLSVQGCAMLHELLAAGHETSLLRGQRAGVREHTLWVRHLEGTSRIGAGAVEGDPEGT